MVSSDTKRSGKYRFRWLEAGRIPPAFDLRTSGWAFDETGHPSSDCIGVLHAGQLEDGDWDRILALPEEVRRFVVVISSATAPQRARLLQAGVGEAVSDTTDAGEFEARAWRLAELTRWLPRHRQVGHLELDLLAREAYGRGKPLNLNPREFALIWRLADNPGESVSKQDLIHDVWRMGFVPETNSIAVHMSRLRRKLGFVGLSGIIATSAAGGYCLLGAEEQAQADAAAAASAALAGANAARRLPAPRRSPTLGIQAAAY
jgi:DNA-binding winged helix-turn-helix (wHTH) protein